MGYVFQGQGQTTKAHINLNGGTLEELVTLDGLEVTSTHPFKGNLDIPALKALIEKEGAAKIAFVRLEAGTNLIGGQPHSLENMREVSKICRDNGLLFVYDSSLLADNLYFIKQREAACKDMSIREITREISDLCDISYFSARKLGVRVGVEFAPIAMMHT